MHYGELWKDYFEPYLKKDFEGAKGHPQREHSPLIYKDAKALESLQLYEIHGTQVPDAINLDLRKGVSVHFANRRAFHDFSTDTIKTITFWVMHTIYFTRVDTDTRSSSKLYCSYVEGIDSTVFCLWQRDHKGFRGSIDEEFFAPSSSYYNLGSLLHTTDLFQSLSISTSSDEILRDTVQKPSDKPRTVDVYKQGTYVYNDFKIALSMFTDISLEYDTYNNPDQKEFLYRDLYDHFKSLRDEMLTAQALLLGDSKKGCHHRLTLYSEIKANWSHYVSKAFKNIPEFSKVHLNPVWLWIRGCPKHIFSCAQFLADVKRIALDVLVSEKEYSYSYMTFVHNLVKNGYHITLACLMCHFFEASKVTGCTYKEVLKKLAEPFDIGCILTGLNGRLYYVPFPNGESTPLLCELTYYNSLEKIELLALPFDNVVGWKQHEFIRALYEQIQVLLKENSECVVLGHVTTQKDLLKMCYNDDTEFEDDNKTHYGISVLASATNISSCGHGMYFFKISEPGNFEEVARNEADCHTHQKQIQEFQGFLYAMSRGLETPSAQWAACVLLSVIECKDLSDVVDTNTERLHLIQSSNEIRRYNESWNVESRVRGSTEDVIAVIDEIVETVCDSEQTEKFNLLSLLAGVVDFTETKAFCGYVAGGSNFHDLILTPENFLKKEANGQLQIDEILKKRRHTTIDDWRVPFLTLLYGSVHRISMQKARCKELPQGWSPQEVVITDQCRLETLLKEAKQRYVFYVQNVQHKYTSSSLVVDKEWKQARESISIPLRNEYELMSAAGTEPGKVNDYHQYYKLIYQRSRM